MKNPLEEIISREILKDGPIPFSRFMELCLYHTEHGYYQQERAVTGGAGGDFYTAPHVHELFGQTITGWARKEAERMGLDEVTLVELGPGNGHLAQDILDSWGEGPCRVEMILVEASCPRKRELESRFRGRPVRVLSPEELDGLDPVRGFVLANEFFDALPFRIFENRGGDVFEIHVQPGQGVFEEVLLPLRDVQENFRPLLNAIPEGFRTELSPEWEDWIFRISRVLEKGRFLIIDYGEFTDGLIVPWRMGGTMRCFHRHQVDTVPYEKPGLKDITAHVNFSFLKDSALSAGFGLGTYTTQSSFLIRNGILDLIGERMERVGEEEGVKLWLSVKNLVHDEGMGEIFKAMVLEKN